MTEETKHPEYENVELDKADAEAETWSEEAIQLDIEGNEIKAQAEWSTCVRCNRPLHTKESRARGLGPTCLAIVNSQSDAENEEVSERLREGNQAHLPQDDLF